ncbi:MAG TPA: lysophospholipid acyltransferase family protein, partial [Flavobacteriia bacterium]|nr:lysophospholipid acyltransferase family protein [Flavobacteriia bacterium]
MSLVNSKEIAKSLNLEKFGVFGTFLGWTMLKVLRVSRLNKIYNKHKNKSDLEFLNAILEEVEIQFEISENDLKRIPKDNAFITISNHPLGGIDGILLLKLILEKRPDYKIIANFLLHRIEPLKPYVLAVNPFEDRKDVKSSVAGIKAALEHIRAGHPLGIFPAGEVSTYKDDKIVIDKPWEIGALKLIKKANVPVIPIYFHAKNSKLFYILSKINGSLRTAKLPSELLNQKNRVIKVRIGKPIWPKEQEVYKDIDSFYQFLRKKTYMLANSFESVSKNKIPTSLKPKRKPKKIIDPVNPQKIITEVKNLQNTDAKLLQSKAYEVFLVSAHQAPHVLKEIGRLREITFREIGEGTNKEIDLDKYDKFYKHLFLWDNDNQKIVGAYRMGIGKDIFKQHGIDGFYINTLFRIEPELYPMM